MCVQSLRREDQSVPDQVREREGSSVVVAPSTGETDLYSSSGAFSKGTGGV